MNLWFDEMNSVGLSLHIDMQHSWSQTILPFGPCSLAYFSSMVIQSLLSHGLCTVQKIGYGPFRNSSVGLMMNEFYQSRFIFEQWYWFYMMFIPYYDDNKFIQQCYDYSFPIMTIYSLLWWVLNSILNIHWFLKRQWHFIYF